MGLSFTNAVKGTTSGTPGTGAFTPNAAASGFLAWSAVSPGWVGLVRFEDGSAWGLSYSYWNGTTLSRSATQFVASSTGSPLNLTSAATAAMVADADTIENFATQPWAGTVATNNQTTLTNIGVSGSPTASGTAAAQSVASTSLYTRQNRIRYTSAVTASAMAGWANAFNVVNGSTTAGVGGFEYVSRFGIAQLAVNGRFMAGVGNSAIISGEPSSAIQGVYFSKDSTDTNIQFVSSEASATKQNTGLALTANGFYLTRVWLLPGNLAAYGLLVRLDTGDIWFGSTTSTLPNASRTMTARCNLGLNGTDLTTAAILDMSRMFIRTGF